MASKVQIHVTRRASDYHACLLGQPGLWGRGPSQAEAIESFLLNHPRYRGLEQEVTYEDQQQAEREKIDDYTLVTFALHPRGMGGGRR